MSFELPLNSSGKFKIFCEIPKEIPIFQQELKAHELGSLVWNKILFLIFVCTPSISKKSKNSTNSKKKLVTSACVKSKCDKDTFIDF